MLLDTPTFNKILCKMSRFTLSKSSFDVQKGDHEVLIFGICNLDVRVKDIYVILNALTFSEPELGCR